MVLYLREYTNNYDMKREYSPERHSTNTVQAGPVAAAITNATICTHFGSRLKGYSRESRANAFAVYEHFYRVFTGIHFRSESYFQEVQQLAVS